MDSNTEKQIKAGKFLPIIFAVLGILYCGFTMLYQTEKEDDKRDLLQFFMGALVTLGGILALYQSYVTQTLIAKLSERKDDEEEGL